MLKLGRDVFGQLFPSRANSLKTVSGNLKGPAKAWRPHQPADLIMASNVLNEFGQPRRSLKARMAFLNQVVRFLKPGGYLLLVEPAQRVASQGLSLLRDAWRGGKSLSLRAPCMGLDTCPMGPHTQFWCHTSFNWQHPEKFLKLIQKVGFQANPLSMSYLLWQKSSAQGQSNGVRLVSDTIAKDKVQSLMGCNLKNELVHIPEKDILELPVTQRGRRVKPIGKNQWAMD